VNVTAVHAQALRNLARHSTARLQPAAPAVDERGEMPEPRRLDAKRATGAMQTEHCDVPGEMTLADWRRERAKRAAIHTPRPPRRSVRRAITGVFRRAA
jgi:hypothetical protein